MRDIDELNINEGGRQVERSAPRVETVIEFERRFGLSLPAEYLELLRHANGGHPELDSILPTSEIGSGPWAVNRFYHLDDDKESEVSLWKATETWQRILGSRALPFANDGGGNQFFLDLSFSPPVVKFCVHDENFRTLEVASSFEDFADSLEVDPEMV